MYTVKNWTVDEKNGGFKRGKAYRTWQQRVRVGEKKRMNESC